MEKKDNLIDKLGKLINVAGTAIMMNLLFLVACIPVVTIGQAWCGLMGAIRYNIRGESWLKGFWVGFKTRWVRGTVAWLVGLTAAAFLLFDMGNARVQMAEGVEGSMLALIGSGVAFAVVAMTLMSALCLNVYIPTSVLNWLRNTVSLLFKGPLGLLVGGGMLWAPAVVFCLVQNAVGLLYELVTVFVCVYFALAAYATTALMKEPLTYFLVQARADGTLTAEEGLRPQPEEDEDE